MRKAVEERAYALGARQAALNEGSALMYWLRAEQELGIIPKLESDDELVTLQELAAEAQALEENPKLRQRMSRCRIRSTRLSRRPSGSLAERTKSGSASTSRASRKGRRRSPGATTVEGGDKVLRRNLRGASRSPGPVVRDVVRV